MMEFFRAQMDYIYFIYGLSFILLGVVCFLTKSKYKAGPVWILLGMFGFTHGLLEWFDLIKLVFGDLGLWFRILRLVLLTSSFILLFEFARDNNNNKIGSWIYLLFSLVLILGWYFFGESGFEILTRFVLGVGGAVGAGLVFWNYNFLSQNKKKFFLVGAVAFWLYGLSQIVNSVGQIFGISITEQAIFFKTFGFPIQFIRAILASIIFSSIWLNYQTPIVDKIYSEKNIKKDKFNRYVAISLIIMFLLGWLITNYLGKIAFNEIDYKDQEFSTLLTGDMSRFLIGVQDLSQLLSGSPSVIQLLQDENPENLEAANLVLDRYKNTADIDITFIINRDGTVVASSNRNSAENLVGNNYIFRSYFSGAMAGKQSSMFAYGITTKKPGYFTGTPIRNNNGEIIGVVVVKGSLVKIAKNLYKDGVMLLVDPAGVVFISANPKYDLKSLAPIPPEQVKMLVEQKIYGRSSFEPLFTEKPTNDSVVTLDGVSYMLDIFPINGSGWNMYVGYKIYLISYYRLFGIVLSSILYFLLVSFFLILQYVRRESSLAYFAAILSSSNDAIVGKDLLGKIISWNDGAEKIYGYKKSEILNKNISLIIPPSSYHQNKKVLDRIATGAVVDVFETEHVRKNGELFNVSLTLSPVKDSFGVIVGTSMIVRDVTKEKKAEDNLVSQMLELEKFKLATDSSTDAIVITDNNSRVLYANKAAENMTGFSNKEILNNYIGHMWGGHMDKNFYEKMWHTIKDEKKGFVGEIRNRRKNGEEYFVNARFYPLFDKLGGVHFFVGVETDISKSKEMDRMKSEFISITSHQLRTPLTGIKWFTELLLKGKAGVLKTEQKDYITQVSDSNERMIQLVDDLLDVSHIDDVGKFKILLVKQDFSNIIREIVDQQKMLAKQKNLKIKLSPSCLKVAMLKVDREKIGQVLQNILNNAIKYSPVGGTITVDFKKENSNYVCSFKDKGVGIPVYQQNRVFEKFFRADNVITVGSGTGLGLYIARYIVEGHGGKMWFESKENKGTTFYFSLPIK